MINELYRVIYGCLLPFHISLLIHYKAYLCHFPGENSPNVIFVPSFQASTRPEMHFETSDLIGRVLQQEPISERLSYVFSIWTKMVELAVNSRKTM